MKIKWLSVMIVSVGLVSAIGWAQPLRGNVLSPLQTPTLELTPPHRPTPTPGVPPWLITPTPLAADEIGNGAVLFVPLIMR